MYVCVCVCVYIHIWLSVCIYTYIIYIYVNIQLAAMLANDGANVYSVDLNGIMLMKRGKVRDFVVA